MPTPYVSPVKIRYGLLLAVLGTAACAPAPPPSLPALPATAGALPASARDVQSVLDRRCVVCHGCYDAPCQFVLSSHEGVARGGSKAAVYDPNRLLPMDPTRLFIDAHGVDEWRQRGFYPLATSDPFAPGSATVLTMMLQLGRAHSFAPGEKLPATLPLGIDQPLTCPRAAEFGDYAAKNPLGGMPYGMAPLSDDEIGVLVGWTGQGAPPPPDPAPLPPAVAAAAARWETYLNRDGLEQRIAARYWYEHWFLAHLYFDDLPESPFFRIVRSRTAPGTAIDEIATVRPYDPPGEAPFWYRLRPLHETIVNKTHIVYPLSEARMRRLSSLFLAGDWKATRLPAYTVEESSNPFIAFDQIPARARYQFMLDDAQYFTMTFIRGPVCRGQVAVDVIEDQFWVAYLDPDRDLSVRDPHFLQEATPFLNLPAEHQSRIVPGEFFAQYGYEQAQYLELRARYYDAADPQYLGPKLDYIWDGDGTNTNAQLTIFRHFDNATVVRGYLGAVPKTAWLLDYPLFERIYYNLVAGYNVFGNVAHQAATRLYMDHLRMQGENLFLNFLPSDQREKIRASWYVGATSTVDYEYADRLHGLNHGTQIDFTTDDPKAELLQMIAARNPKVSGPPDLLNRCAAPPCDRPGASPLERRAERALQPLAGVHGPWVATLPEVSFLRVRDGSGGAVYTLVHDRAHTNVALMFDEEARLVPADDTLTVARGYLGSYPNFAFDVEAADIETFTTTLAAVQTPADLEQLAARWGVRRSSPAMWTTLDWMHDDYRRREPVQFGLFDLNRYENR
jgi:hypothetical protein